MTTTTIPKWHVTGKVVQACSCDWGCPCDFNAPPSRGFCHGTWTWHIERGTFGDVKMDGVRFGASCKWPGQLHEGNGEAMPIIDAKASPAQMEAIGTLLSGNAGGPWAIVATTLTKVHEPKVVDWDVHFDGESTTITAGDALTMTLTPMKNPVTGAVHQARVVLPTGFISHEMNKATTTAYNVHGSVTMDYPGKDAAWGEFDYSGPS